MTNLYDLVIFDCDGTVVDSEWAIAKASVSVLHELGFINYTPDLYRQRFIGQHVEKIIDLLGEEFGPSFVKEDFLGKLPHQIRHHILHEVTAMPGAEEMLAQLHLPHCIASNGRRQYVVDSLSNTGLIKFFSPESIFTYEQVANSKPAPDLFLFAADKMGGFAPHRCLVIEDSYVGTLAANLAGMDVIVLQPTTRQHQAKLSTLKTKCYIRNLTEILELL